MRIVIKVATITIATAIGIGMQLDMDLPTKTEKCTHSAAVCQNRSSVFWYFDENSIKTHCPGNNFVAALRMSAIT